MAAGAACRLSPLWAARSGLHDRVVRPRLALLASELYPRRVGHENRVAPSLPPLPQWCATLALGIAWSAL